MPPQQTQPFSGSGATLPEPVSFGVQRSNGGENITQVRSQRVMLKVSIVVFAQGDDKKMISEETRTVTVNAHGAMIVLTAKVSVGQWIRSRPNAGLPFSVITGKRLLRWTSSLFRRSRSARSIASSSSVTIVGAFCTSMSQSIRQAYGSSSSCEKHFPLNPLRGSSSLDHIIAVDERHLKRLLAEHIRYYHEDRTHLGLGKGTPDGRTRAIASGRVLSHVRLGGLHYRYDRAA